MNINHNKIHGCHGIHNQIQTSHDFVHRIVRGLPPANHDGESSKGTLGDLMFEGVNHKRNALIHQAVEIGGLTRHLHHHANLKPRHKDIQSTKQNQKTTTTPFPLPITGDP